MSAPTEGAKTSEPAKLLSPLQVAQRLDVGVVVVRRWIETAQLRAIDTAAVPGPNRRRRWRISLADLAAFEKIRANSSGDRCQVTGVSRSKPERAKEVTEFIT